MKYFLVVALILTTAGVGIAKKKKKKSDEPPPPPPCIEEEGIIQSYRQQLIDLVAKVKSESLGEFERNYHQKTAENFLTFWSSNLDVILECYQKALEDPLTTKEIKAEVEPKLESSTGQVEQLKAKKEALKKARRPRNAKAVIEEFDFGSAEGST